MIKSRIITPKSINGWVSRQLDKGTATYDLDSFYSPDNALSQSVVLDLASPKFEPNKTYWFDKSKYNNHATISGAVWRKLPSGLWVLKFDATDDSVTFGDTSSLAFMHGKGNTTGFSWTYVCWFNQASPGTANAPLLDTNAGDSANTGFVIYANTSRLIRIQITRGVAAEFILNYTSTTAYPNSTLFNHLVLTYDQSLANTNLKLYLNKVAIETGNKTGLAPVDGNSTNAPLIGRFNGPSGAFDGMMVFARIYKDYVFTQKDVDNDFYRGNFLLGV